MAINLSLNRQAWYTQVLLFVLVSLAAVFVFWWFYASPAGADIEARRGELTQLRAEIARGLGIAQRLPEFRQELVALESQLERLRTVLPEEQDVGDLLSRVNEMATQSNLTIRGFTPQAVARQQLHAEWPIGLEIEGTYHDLGDFLERVSKFPRIINVGNLAIRATDGAPGGATITADLTATTFVLIEPAAPAAPAPPAGGGA